MQNKTLLVIYLLKTVNFLCFFIQNDHRMFTVYASAAFGKCEILPLWCTMLYKLYPVCENFRCRNSGTYCNLWYFDKTENDRIFMFPEMLFKMAGKPKCVIHQAKSEIKFKAQYSSYKKKLFEKMHWFCTFYCKTNDWKSNSNYNHL